jgi:hypothetical protein
MWKLYERFPRQIEPNCSFKSLISKVLGKRHRCRSEDENYRRLTTTTRSLFHVASMFRPTALIGMYTENERRKM